MSMGMAFGMGMLGSGGTSGANSLLQQLSGSSAVLAVYDWTDTSAVFPRNGYAYYASAPLLGVTNLKGINSGNFASWIASQPSIVASGTKTSNGTHGEWLSDTSLRAARDATTVGNVTWSPAAAGWYYVSGTSSLYDGAVSGITTYRCIIYNNGSTEGTDARSTGDPGAFALIRYVAAGGGIRFQGSGVGIGFRVDNLKIVKLPDYGMWQVTTGAQPVYNKGALFDGVDDELITQFPTSNTQLSNIHVVAIVATTDQYFCLFGTNASNIRGGRGVISGVAGASPGVGTPTYEVAGTDLGQATEGDLYSSVVAGSGSPKVVVMRNANFNSASISQLRTSRAGNDYLAGRSLNVAIIDASHPEAEAALAAAKAEASRQITALAL